MENFELDESEKIKSSIYQTKSYEILFIIRLF